MLHIILYAIVPIVVVMLAGFISGKKGIFNGDDSKKFNKVVLDYALPAALFVSIVQADREMLARDLKLSIVSLIVIMVCFMAVYFIYRYCFKKNTGADAAVSALISGSPTIGFLGFAVLEPIFGTNPSVALVVAIVGIVVNAVGIPVGLSLLNASLDGTQAAAAGKKESAWKPVIHALEQPVAWAPILAVILVLLGLKWPDWASPSFDLIAKANASMAVFSAGITLSSVKIVINWQALLGSILKLIVMPALALIAGLLWHMDPLNIKMLVVACALPPAFSGIIIADEYNTYVATGTSSLTLSVILFIGFCPLWIWITDMALNAF
ncbi:MULTISPECIES: AEC family transporter [Muribaculum]|uniref:AEC family transporter n=2 Tax=Muribaculaceae TaxID=2005473 RepID=UPI000F479F77|nr:MULTISPECIES: AEC family transporter [Muribaculum]MCX4277896.1 AEC family transporter [Muribaculum sp.]ROT15565.1 permease [Muribaculaceae bacterium Isolate-102 (HZI)]